MSAVAIKAKLLAWGNSFGLRISRHDVERLHLKPDTEVEVQVQLDDSKLTVYDLPSFDLGGDAADRHDELFAKSVEDHLRRKRKK